MFYEREMTDALTELHEMFSQVSREIYERRLDSDPLTMAIPSMHDLCMALCDQVQTVYQFRFRSNLPECGHYCGKDLFGQRAVRLVTALQDYTDDVLTVEYADELWLLEDMRFVVVAAVSISFLQGEISACMEYRACRHTVQSAEDLCFHPDDFLDSLSALYEEYRSGKKPIYAM